MKLFFVFVLALSYICIAQHPFLIRVDGQTPRFSAIHLPTMHYYLRYPVLRYSTVFVAPSPFGVTPRIDNTSTYELCAGLEVGWVLNV